MEKEADPKKDLELRQKQRQEVLNEVNQFVEVNTKLLKKDAIKSMHEYFQRIKETMDQIKNDNSESTGREVNFIII
jgi:primosomal protein N''